MVENPGQVEVLLLYRNKNMQNSTSTSIWVELNFLLNDPKNFYHAVIARSGKEEHMDYIPPFADSYFNFKKK